MTLKVTPVGADYLSQYVFAEASVGAAPQAAQPQFLLVESTVGGAVTGTPLMVVPAVQLASPEAARAGLALLSALGTLATDPALLKGMIDALKECPEALPPGLIAGLKKCATSFSNLNEYFAGEIANRFDVWAKEKFTDSQGSVRFGKWTFVYAIQENFRSYTFTSADEDYSIYIGLTPRDREICPWFISHSVNKQYAHFSCPGGDIKGRPSLDEESLKAITALIESFRSTVA